jgi:dUTP pyrophosphatase
MKVSIKKLNPNAKIPTYGSSYAAGADLYACIESEVVIAPHTVAVIPTGFAMELPEGLAGFVYARSGMATKRHLAPANMVGVIDCDYRGEVKVALRNYSDEPQKVTPFERVAQLVIAPYITAEFEEAEELSATVRGKGGFGSTGTK